VKGQTFTVTFPVAGNFKLVCLAHKDMTATVHVLALSAPLPYSQAQYDEQAEAERGNLFSSMDADGDHDGDHGDHHSHHQHLPANQVIAGTGVGSATAGGHENLAVMRFLSDETVIHAGETVEWSNLDPAAIHTITFGVEPANLVAPSSNVTVDADGARHATINSITDNVHSGSIASAPQERPGLAQAPLGITRFRVTFTHPGIYLYICALHDQLGMKGEVIVLP
jgi:plastocyanin